MIPDPDALCDTTIVESVLGGDVDSFALLIGRHKQDLFATIRGHVPAAHVEEVAHETFIRAFEKLDTYKGNSPFRHWLMVIATRKCVDYWRQVQRQHSLVEDSLAQGGQDLFSGADAVLGSEEYERRAHEEDARQLVNWALGFLSPEDRVLIGLIYKDELPYGEIAKRMGWSLVRVKVRAHRARKKIKHLLASAYPGEGKEDDTGEEVA